MLVAIVVQRHHRHLGVARRAAVHRVDHAGEQAGVLTAGMVGIVVEVEDTRAIADGRVVKLDPRVGLGDVRRQGRLRLEGVDLGAGIDAAQGSQPFALVAPMSNTTGASAPAMRSRTSQCSPESVGEQ